MRKFVETWVNDIVPMARMIMEENKALSKRCTVMWNAKHGFEVNEDVYRFIVDFRTMTYTCRSWMLRDILCQHTLCALYDREIDPDDYVSHWYRKETFLKTYQHFIQPIPNMKMWQESTNPCIEPPESKPMPGRPKRCRRKAKDEPRKKHGKLSKKGIKMTCSNCQQTCHNKSGCRNMVVLAQDAPAASQARGGTLTPNACTPDQIVRGL
uniref:SWIM-type domain-containing protein n=1 Tax=Nicotiana tabacum TaxID=4097 RepID=A0A1S4C6M4_TOBAC|nr:PREDICTED: uncharacterized protein LOC107815764 [Nicotiana tabacum]